MTGRRNRRSPRVIDRPTTRGSRAGLALLALAVACARNPVSGRPEVTLVSKAQERELGEAEAKRVAETMGIVDDRPELSAYVRAVGERLARVSPRTDVTYTFQIVDLEEPNAFALPGGPVYISRGLLALTNSEDELAGVLGHEIGHVAARHAVRRVTRAAPLAVVTGLGAAVTGLVSPILGDLVGGIGGVAGALVLAPYSREQEREADRIGQELAAKAGWDPAGLSRSLHTLEREEALHPGEKRPNAFFATHPPLPDRVADTLTRAASLERTAAPLVAGPGGILPRLDGLVVGPSAANGVFDGETFLHPDLEFRVRFPAGWKTANDRTVVGASAPDGRAIVGLELVDKGSDPDAALRAFEQGAKIDLASHADRLRVGDLPATHATAAARTREGVVALDLTWIAYADRIYRIVGATPPDRAAAAKPLFRSTVESFRPLTADERAGIRETRLRIVDPRRGERLVDVLRRTHSPWTPDVAAVANGLEGGGTLRPEQPVKIAVVEPYAAGR